MAVTLRELAPGEFTRVERELWIHYHGQTADAATDRLVGAFADERLVGAARVKRHADGLEVDGVFVLDDCRGRGIARRLMEAVLAMTGDQVLWLHSLLELVPFYASLGFAPVAERDLPPTIKERLIFCMGNMEGCGVSPMVRHPPVEPEAGDSSG